MFKSRVKDVVLNDKLTNLKLIVANSHSCRVQNLKNTMNLLDYDTLLFKYIKSVQNLTSTKEEFFDTYSHDEVNQMYIDCIAQEFI